MTIVETARLRLRPMQASDAGAFLEIHQHPEVIKYVLLGAPPGGITVAWRNVAMMIGHWQLRGYGSWAVTEKSTDQVLGRVGLWNPEGWPGLELGWVIRPSRWGNGFATEAALAALQWTWDHVKTDHIISIIQPDNARSIRVAEKIGERFERAHVMSETDVHIYGVVRPTAADRV
jgi:RimJ/RimL family protein N-acetyltransferase